MPGLVFEPEKTQRRDVGGTTVFAYDCFWYPIHPLNEHEL